MFVLGVVLIVIIVPVAVLFYLYRRPLPQVEGTLAIRGLTAPVEIIRDKWGVPHVYAQNREDLLFAQGYVHAQDRLWQMELLRRLGHGRLSELIGDLTFSTDRLIRTLGFSRTAQKDLEEADEEERCAAEAYAAGVNAFIETCEGRFPLEFTLLSLKPEPWTPLDTLVIGKIMMWNLSNNWDGEVLFAALVEQLGAERAAQLFDEYPRENPLILPDQSREPIFRRVLEEFQAMKTGFITAQAGGMSNNWVVDGSKSTTGKPLLANDPHLPPQMPSIWYEAHLVSPELQAAGITLPGVPGIIGGHNAEIAWGFTAAFPDVQDLYVEKFHPDDPSRYYYQNTWLPVQVIREEIGVKGESSPRTVEVRITRHGPILKDLSPLAEGNETMGLALRWVGHELSHSARAILRLNQARNWQEVCEALRDWILPSLNFVYADREGNIGYYMTGKVPIRSKGSGFLPVPGWTGEYEWTGWIPHEQMPHGLNPDQHYLATANNQVVGEEYPYFLTAQTMNGFRARRIVELLSEKEKLSVQDFARIQVDQYCAPAKTFCELMLELENEILEQPALINLQQKAKEAMNTLRQWDYHLTATSVAGAIFEMTQYFAMYRTFEPWLGHLIAYYVGVGSHPLLAPVTISTLDRSFLVLHRILINDENDWFKDADGQPISRAAILALALQDAINHLSQAVGEEMPEWQWGRIHQVAYKHPFGERKPLDKIFNRGPYPYGGDTNTVWQAAFVPRLPIQPDGGFTASWRQILDLSDWDNSVGIHAPGQSGHPASPHYADLIPLWLNGEYHPLLWSRPKVEQHAEARLRLEPMET